MIPAVDLFAGAGGWTTGATLSGRVRVLWAANHWPDAVACHSANHPEVAHACQDLMQADWRALPDLRDGVLIASPACQGISPCGQPGRVVRGAAAKHQADRNTAWAVPAAADIARPRRLVIENVPFFQRWELYRPWLALFEAMGYRLNVQVLNAAGFGVPQDRPRTIITASLDGKPAPIQPTGERVTLGDVIDHDGAHEWMPIESKAARKNKHGETIADRMRASQRRNGSACFWANVDKSRGRRFDETAPTMTTKSESQWFVLRGNECRKLSIPELAAIQGFPTGYRLPSDSRLAGKLLGNAVPVRMARAVIEQAVATNPRPTDSGNLQHN